MEPSGRDVSGGAVVVFAACLTVLVALAIDWDRMLTGEHIDLSTVLPCDGQVGSRWENADGTTSWDVQVPVVCTGTGPLGLALKN